jgi:hypothetical protein
MTKSIRRPVTGPIAASKAIRLNLNRLIIREDVRPIPDRRSGMTGVPATMGRDMIALSDDALIIDDNVRTPLDKRDRRIAMSASLIDVPPNYWETNITLLS